MNLDGIANNANSCTTERKNAMTMWIGDDDDADRGVRDRSHSSPWTVVPNEVCSFSEHAENIFEPHIWNLRINSFKVASCISARKQHQLRRHNGDTTTKTHTRSVQCRRRSQRDPLSRSTIRPLASNKRQLSVCRTR